MINALALALHALAAVLWVGGMFFAHQCLRPAALKLDPPQRMTLWRDTFARFFPWVWSFVVILPVTGLYMLFKVHGGFATAGGHIHAMLALGIVMIVIFLHVYFAPYRRLCRAVEQQQFKEGADHLAKIRKMVGINIVVGLVTVAVAAGGRLLG